MKPEIIYTSGPEGFCPVQAEGTVDGFPFYFRARHEALRIYIADSPMSIPLDKSSWHYSEKYGDNPHSAGYAQKVECIAFINKAAELWANKP